MNNYYKTLEISETADAKVINQSGNDLQVKLKWSLNFFNKTLRGFISQGNTEQFLHEISLLRENDFQALPLLCSEGKTALCELDNAVGNSQIQSNLPLLLSMIDKLTPKLKKQIQEVEEAFNVLGDNAKRLIYQSRLNFFRESLQTNTPLGKPEIDIVTGFLKNMKLG